MLAAPYVAARRRMPGRGWHAFSPSPFLHGDDQDHMGEVLQKELPDRQPKISVAHDQARLEVGGQNIGAKTTGDVCLEDGKNDEIGPPGGDDPIKPR